MYTRETQDLVSIFEAAIERNDVALVRKMVSQGILDTINPVSRTPLMTAASNDAVDICMILVEAGSNPAARIPNSRWQPIHFAACQGAYNALGYLISIGADINARCDSEWTPLLISSDLDRDECFDLLIEQGADIHAKTARGYNAVGLAALKGNIGMVQRLLELGVDPQIPEDIYDFPWSHPEQQRCIHLIESAIERGALVSSIHSKAIGGDAAGI